MSQGGTDPNFVWVVLPSCYLGPQRAALVNLGDLTTYDTAKHFFLIDLQASAGCVTPILQPLPDFPPCARPLPSMQINQGYAN